MNPWWVALVPPLAGFLLDLLLGDPAWPFHPVRLLGRTIAFWERKLRSTFPASPPWERVSGVMLAVITPLTALFVSAALSALAWRAGSLVWVGAETISCYFLFACRDLQKEGMAVYRRLLAADLSGARLAVARIVGRDTDALDEAGVVRAAVETVAENTCDGVVAPMLYILLGGSPLGWLYKAVNTLDSMVGYRNDRYRHFGTASARLDDALNYIPSRVAAVAMILVCPFVRLTKRGALRIWRRDRRNHASPNSAQTEAACAGALGIQLGGDARYGGRTHHKPTIGDPLRPAEAADIPRCCRLMTAASVLVLLLGTGVRALLLWIFF